MGRGESGKEGTEEGREAETGGGGVDERDGCCGWVVEEGRDRGARGARGAGGRCGRGLLELQVSEH